MKLRANAVLSYSDESGRRDKSGLACLNVPPSSILEKFDCKHLDRYGEVALLPHAEWSL